MGRSPHATNRDTLFHMGRGFLHRIHNPRNRQCACDPDCWCQRTAVGRAVKWWVPGRYFGLHHRNRKLEAWKRGGVPGSHHDYSIDELATG
jgi:hypothetical protein